MRLAEDSDTPTAITSRSSGSCQAGPEASASSAAPTTIGRYQVVCPLGIGGMARVYLCQTRGVGGFQKLLVVKVPRPDVLADEETREMFLHEARIAGRLNHPNVVQTNEVDLAAGVPFIAMEFLEGQSLATLQKTVGLEKLSTELQLRVLANVLSALHYAHELTDYDGSPLRIVHRDVSPQNVFVTYDGVVKLLDFGIAKAAGGGGLTRDGVIKGKLAYIAPEQAAVLPVDRRVDIFAVGVMIWEAVAHRRLVPPGYDELAILRRRMAGEEPSLNAVVPDAPPELVEICARAMARRPEDRYPSAWALKEAIESYLLSSSQPTEATLGRYMSEVFAVRRREMRERIDGEMRQPVSGMFPTGRASFESHDGAELSAPGTAVTAGATTPRPEHAPTPRRGWVIGAVMAVGAAFLAWSLVGGRPSEPVHGKAVAPAMTSSGEPRDLAELPSARPAVPRAKIRIRVVPTSAELTVDGQPAGSSYDAELPASTEPHQISASAPGHKPTSRVVTFDRDVTVDLRLTPLSHTATGAKVSASPEREPKARRELGASPSRAAARSLDEEDPYR